MSYVMGIDIGTYESKGVIVDRTGKLLVSASIPHRLEIPERGWAEHDAEYTWWHDFTYLSQTLVSELEEVHRIKALSLFCDIVTP